MKKLISSITIIAFFAIAIVMASIDITTPETLGYPISCPNGTFWTFVNDTGVICEAPSTTSGGNFNLSGGSLTGAVDVNATNINADSLNSIKYADTVAKIISYGEAGGHIIIPCGHYSITEAIDLASNTYFEGSGKDCTILTLVTNTNTALINLDSVNNVTIKRITLNHGSQSADAHNLRIVSSNNILIEENHILNAYHHNINGGANNLTVINNIIEKAGQGAVDGGEILLSGNNVKAISNTVYHNDFVGIQCYSNSKNCIVSENLIYHKGTTGALGGIYSGGLNDVINNNIISGIGQNADIWAIKLASVNTTVIGNNINSLNKSIGGAIYFAGVKNSIVSNNNINNVNYGFYIEGDYNIISDNIISNTGNVAVYFRNAAQNNIFDSNSIIDSGSYGVYLQSSAVNTVISNNFVTLSSNDNIQSDAEHTIISNNIVTSGNADGIVLNGINNSAIIGNLVYGNSNNQIVQTSLGSGTVVANNVEN